MDTVVSPITTSTGGLVRPVDRDTRVTVGPTGTVSTVPSTDTGATTVATVRTTVPVDV